MDLNEYQRIAKATDQIPATVRSHPSDIAMLIPILGLAGETGTILSEYKKWLRDGPSHELFEERIAEELGDLLWYISNCATKFGLDLEDIARKNNTKCRTRWERTGQRQLRLPLNFFDASFPPEEQLPRQFTAELTTVEQEGIVKSVCTVDGRRFGDPLSDNRYDDDGYRFHDVLHLAFAGVLSWSPIVRRFLKRKRRSNPQVDEIEDGGRAIVVEEGIAALIFSFAERHTFLESMNHVDYELLRTIKNMTQHLEVTQCSEGQWEDAILQGFHVWRYIRKENGGRIVVNLDEAHISFASTK